MEGRSFRSKWAVFALFCVSGTSAGQAATVPSAASPNVAEITARLTRSEQAKKSNLQEFSVTRRYVLRNTHSSAPAEMTVRLAYRKGQGKTFEILQTTNASGVRRRVLDRILAAEVEASRPDAHEGASLTPDNYDFELAGAADEAGRKCWVLKLHPKKKAKFLIEGNAWIDAEDYAVVKIEGRLAANLSFWVGKPYVTQEFRKCGDFWMASRNHSLTESHLLGRSELTIDYTSYEVHAVQGTVVAAQRVKSGTPLD
jgi:hypothetical protein